MTLLIVIGNTTLTMSYCKSGTLPITFAPNRTEGVEQNE
jgi:hypothetical protein